MHNKFFFESAVNGMDPLLLIPLFFYVALQPNAGYGLLIHEVFEITYTTRHSR
jgi:hypothetical protein